MNHPELMAYLDAVCDAESAIQACSDAIAACEERIRRLPAASAPGNALHPAPARRRTIGWNWKMLGPSMTCLAMLVIPVGLLAWGLTAVGVFPDCAGAAHALWITLALVFVCVLLFSILAEKRAVNRKRSEAEEEAAAAMSMLTAAIKGYEAMRRSAQEKLCALYAMDILDLRFRNPAAVCRIREYLNTGACGGLDGPSGAYARYEQDVHIPQERQAEGTVSGEGLSSALRFWLESEL